jgi:hypothetical protein
MTYEFNQETYWDGATFYQQNLDTPTLDPEAFYDETSLGLTVSVVKL